MALEQCDYRRDACITDFYLILDHLINTTKDVDLLSDEGIIVNRLGDSNTVTSMINNLSKGIFKRSMNSDYCELYEALNAFYEVEWHRWNAIIKNQGKNAKLTLKLSVLSIQSSNFQFFSIQVSIKILLVLALNTPKQRRYHVFFFFF